MLPLSHTYVSTKATGKSTPLLILGSILPDISSTSAKQIGRDQIHNSPKEFANFINTNYPNLSDLGMGVRLHSQVGGGADFYSDDPKTGYAKIHGAVISAEVADLLEIPNGDISMTLAHNFIEMAVDIHLYQNQNEIWNIYNKAIKEVNSHLKEVSKCMTEYLKMNEETVEKELLKLISFMHPNNLISKESAIDTLGLPLTKIRFHKEVSRDKTLEIAEKALNITANTYLEYLNNAVKEVKKNILRA